MPEAPVPDEREPRRFGHDLYDEEAVEEARVVRPYALTRGRTRPGRSDLPLEALVRVVAGATDPVGTAERRRIQRITQLREQGLDLQWQRVYGYPEEAHVRFNHAPHIRAKVECATCHGNLAEQTVAQRSVEHSMGFCVNCHTERLASIDFLTCHF